MLERDFEDILAKYPELIEDGLELVGRQTNLGGKFLDLHFNDRYGQSLIVEIKIGPIKREHIGQVLDYEGRLLPEDAPTLRVMLLGNRVPPSLRRSLDHHGIEWKEITEGALKAFLHERGDGAFLDIFSEDKIPIHGKMSLNSTRHRSPRSASVKQKMRALFSDGEGNKILDRSEIIGLVLENYPDTNRGSVIPSDYCYNIVNKGIPFERHPHYFEALPGGHYMVLGENYPYRGDIKWKGMAVGTWTEDNQPNINWDLID